MDLPYLSRLVESLQASDRYPPHCPPSTGSFVAARDELCAFVAEDEHHEIIGHVSLHERGPSSAIDLAAKTLGVEPRHFASVARLFVDPSSRRLGIARQLLDAAQAEAHRLGRRPILDVWIELRRAIRLYDSMGWRRAGEVTLQFTSPCTPRCSHSGRSIRSFVYIGPRRRTTTLGR